MSYLFKINAVDYISLDNGHGLILNSPYTNKAYRIFIQGCVVSLASAYTGRCIYPCECIYMGERSEPISPLNLFERMRVLLKRLRAYASSLSSNSDRRELYKPRMSKVTYVVSHTSLLSIYAK